MSKMLKLSLLAGVTLAPLAYFLGVNKDVKFVSQDEFIKTHSKDSEKTIKEYRNYIDTLEQKLKENKISNSEKETLVAINNYGLTNVLALALNGRYECPSAKEQRSRRCSIREEVAVMFATLNLVKQGHHGKSISEVVYSKQSSGRYTFSWVPKIQNRDITSPIFKHSLNLAISVLGGDSDLAQYDYGQTHYCEQNIAKCSWHKNASTLIELGKLNLSNSEIKEIFVKEDDLSFHTFYKDKSYQWEG